MRFQHFQNGYFVFDCQIITKNSLFDFYPMAGFESINCRLRAIQDNKLWWVVINFWWLSLYSFFMIWNYFWPQPDPSDVLFHWTFCLMSAHNKSTSMTFLKQTSCRQHLTKCQCQNIHSNKFSRWKTFKSSSITDDLFFYF